MCWPRWPGPPSTISVEASRKFPLTPTVVVEIFNYYCPKGYLTFHQLVMIIKNSYPGKTNGLSMPSITFLQYAYDEAKEASKSEYFTVQSRIDCNTFCSIILPLLAERENTTIRYYAEFLISNISFNCDMNDRIVDLHAERGYDLNMSLLSKDISENVEDTKLNPDSYLIKDDSSPQKVINIYFDNIRKLHSMLQRLFPSNQMSLEEFLEIMHGVIKNLNECSVIDLEHIYRNVMETPLTTFSDLAVSKVNLDVFLQIILL